MEKKIEKRKQERSNKGRGKMRSSDEGKRRKRKK